MTTLIVFSHLRWNFVLQRPQHLLSRLAAHRQVLFFEEPVGGATEPWLERTTPSPNVEVLCPHVSVAQGGFHDDHLPALQQLLGDYLQENGIDDYAVWFYTPMAFPLASGLTPRGIVYDCMDELTAFRHAPRQLVQRENVLLKEADLVFTGGPSLYESKRNRHPDVHCFPSSVDAAHFSQRVADHPAQAHLPHPRLGYYGVIDERLDLSLIAALADAHAEWQIVMVGPVAKIDPASLPQRPNIQWMGQRDYAELPAFLAGWDVSLLPFALNEATRFISPTKTLEYLAAGKPSVSTPIRDVVEPYSGVVKIAVDAAEFIAACEDILAWTPADRQRFAEAAAAVVAHTSWDRTVESMNRLLSRFERPALALPRAMSAPGQRSDAPATPHHPTVVIGAGPTGLAAALELGGDALLLEREQSVGGWCRSVVDRGFTFDLAGHTMGDTDPWVLALYGRLLGDNVHWQDREAWVYSKSVYTRYPFQGALYGLPPEVVKECLIGAIEARFGPLKKPELRVASTEVSPAATAAPAVPVPHSGTPRNFEEFIYRVWGAGVAKHFAIPYHQKRWAVPLDEIETSWLGSRVPLPNLEEIISGALEPAPRPSGPGARFGYPQRGGFQALMEGFLPLLENAPQLGAEVVAVSPLQRSVTLADGRRYGYDTLISTLPLPQLVAAMGDEAPAAVREAAAALRHVSVRRVNLGIALEGRDAITEKHWIYYPEDTVFHRIFVQGNASPHCSPPGGFGLTCEIAYSDARPLPADGDALVERCIADCIGVGLLREGDQVIAASQVDIPRAYVVYDHARAAHVDTIRRWTDAADILLADRDSEWEYDNAEHAFTAGRKAAAVALARNAALMADGKSGDAVASAGA
ncbi:MAG: glycosyl transferase group 1 [Rhodoferax sp.]|nr:glycosyl transferase group 1 [Rhodoferax sp.]